MNRFLYLFVSFFLFANVFYVLRPVYYPVDQIGSYRDNEEIQDSFLLRSLFEFAEGKGGFPINTVPSLHFLLPFAFFFFFFTVGLKKKKFA
jgi:hypothetical protein